MPIPVFLTRKPTRQSLNRIACQNYLEILAPLSAQIQQLLANGSREVGRLRLAHTIASR